MARGKTLGILLNALRAETRVSLTASHNYQARDAQVLLLQRTQEWLWEDFDWPHMRITRQYPLAVGQRHYDFSADFDIERIERIEMKTDGHWYPMLSGIGPEAFAVYDSDLDQRGYPPRRWRLVEDDQIEIWPISDTNGDEDTLEGYLQVTGIKRLSPLVEESDTADLDDRLIVLYAAAEVLGGKGSKDANIKLSLATKRHAKLRGHQVKRRGFRMFGVGRAEMPRRPVITNYRPPE